MSQSNKKYLVSGCGLSFGGQERKTWVNVLRTAGLNIADVGGPAVSNQWILNKAITAVFENNYDCVIIQLTSLGKLDVEVDPERIKELVEPDTVRNFTYQNIWPSSASLEHTSKQLWRQWLSSPGLEMEDLVCKLLLLDAYCRSRRIQLQVYQGYSIPWSDTPRFMIADIVRTNTNLYDAYPKSDYYQYHDHSNSVPCLLYQFELAEQIARDCCPEILDRVKKTRSQNETKTICKST